MESISRRVGIKSLKTSSFEKGGLRGGLKQLAGIETRIPLSLHTGYVLMVYVFFSFTAFSRMIFLAGLSLRMPLKLG